MYKVTTLRAAVGTGQEEQGAEAGGFPVAVNNDSHDDICYEK